MKKPGGHRSPVLRTSNSSKVHGIYNLLALCAMRSSWCSEPGSHVHGCGKVTRCRPLGVLHPQWQDHRAEGGGGAGWRILPHRRHAEQWGEGEGGSSPPQRLTDGKPQPIPRQRFIH